MKDTHLGISNMNGITEEDDSTCALKDMNCLDTEEEKKVELKDMNALTDDDDVTCALRDMNCLDE